MRILVLDGHPLYGEMLGALLEELAPGATCEVFSELEPALDEIARTQPSVVIVDPSTLSWPTQERILKALHEKIGAAAVSFVLTSGACDAAIADAPHLMQFDAIIPKAASGDVLEARLKAVLEHGRHQRGVGEAATRH